MLIFFSNKLPQKFQAKWNMPRCCGIIIGYAMVNTVN